MSATIAGWPPRHGRDRGLSENTDVSPKLLEDQTIEIEGDRPTAANESMQTVEPSDPQSPSFDEDD